MKNKALNLIDIITFVYLAWVISILIVFFDKISNPIFYIFFCLGYILLILLIIRLYRGKPENMIFIFLRLSYPLLFLEFFYKFIEKYVLVLTGKFFDEMLIKFESLIFSVNPAQYLERFANPVITEIMKFSYFSYYFYVFSLIMILFFTKKYDKVAYSVVILSLTYYACYIGFILFPIQGPRFILDFKITHLDGYFFTQLQDWLMVKGQSIGACMPSSHLAVSWNVVFLFKKFFGKKFFYPLFILTVIMSISIVYNRYHYFFDAVAGILTGFICYQAGKLMYKKWWKGRL